MVGEIIPIKATIALDGINPDDILVEIYYGLLDSKGGLPEGKVEVMRHAEDLGKGKHLFTGELPCLFSGKHGYCIRVLPKNDLISQKFETRLIIWC